MRKREGRVQSEIQRERDREMEREGRCAEKREAETGKDTLGQHGDRHEYTRLREERKRRDREDEASCARHVGWGAGRHRQREAREGQKNDNAWQARNNAEMREEESGED